ncbi:uncharacterized protein BXZ73DRAFT_76343 [Epithele typhae]|uniref:uncharacterized protein n=1 Tax=Epithele typhae TaxID=378194 RepID=UPI0020088CCE|nr:uncharacterized protein BXZ73DRAFT_76343 [Epithele typhae]KAH9938840.1 hypothetical protein BXZ73DRAFT_76343 [Epithele typhae]
MAQDCFQDLVTVGKDETIDTRRTLPVELWLKVISEIESREDLICLSRTRSNFREATKDLVADWIAVIRTEEDADQLATRIRSDPRFAQRIHEVSLLPLEDIRYTFPPPAQMELMLDVVVQLPELFTLRLFVQVPELFREQSSVRCAASLELLYRRHLPRLRCLDAPIFDLAPFYAFLQRNPNIEELQVPHDSLGSVSLPASLPSLRFLTCQFPVLVGLTTSIRESRFHPRVTIWDTLRPSDPRTLRGSLTHLHLTGSLHYTFEEVLNKLGANLVSLRMAELTPARFLSGEAFPSTLILLHAPRLRYLELEFFKGGFTTARIWPPKNHHEGPRDHNRASFPARTAGEPLTLAWCLSNKVSGAPLDSGDLLRFRQRCKELALSVLRSAAPHVGCILYGHKVLTEKATLGKCGRRLVNERLTYVRRDHWRTV